jgi:hypothetical protein
MLEVMQTEMDPLQLIDQKEKHYIHWNQKKLKAVGLATSVDYWHPL